MSPSICAFERPDWRTSSASRRPKNHCVERRVARNRSVETGTATAMPSKDCGMDAWLGGLARCSATYKKLSNIYVLPDQYDFLINKCQHRGFCGTARSKGLSCGGRGTEL